MNAIRIRRRQHQLKSSIPVRLRGASYSRQLTGGIEALTSPALRCDLAGALRATGARDFEVDLTLPLGLGNLYRRRGILGALGLLDSALRRRRLLGAFEKGLHPFREFRETRP